jgi:hypothetical protein
MPSVSQNHRRAEHEPRSNFHIIIVSAKPAAGCFFSLAGTLKVMAMYTLVHLIRVHIRPSKFLSKDLTRNLKRHP